MDISRPCQPEKLIPLLFWPGFDPSFSGHNDEQSSASGHDHASDRSVIGAGLIYICPDQDSIPVSQDTMIDEQSSASGHDHASDRSVIGPGLIYNCPDQDSIPVSQDTMTNNHQQVDMTTPQTAQPSRLNWVDEDDWWGWGWLGRKDKRH